MSSIEERSKMAKKIKINKMDEPFVLHIKELSTSFYVRIESAKLRISLMDDSNETIIELSAKQLYSIKKISNRK